MNKNLFKQQRDIARKKYFLRKYQRALDNLALHSIRSEDVETIQELVDKETPMKPINKYKIDFGIGNCGDCLKCESLVNYQMTYCSGCGQRIDWSEDND